jgi:hypothetical protein
VATRSARITNLVLTDCTHPAPCSTPPAGQVEPPRGARGERPSSRHLQNAAAAQSVSRDARSNPEPRASSRSERAWRGLRAVDPDADEHGGTRRFDACPRENHAVIARSEATKQSICPTNGLLRFTRNDGVVLSNCEPPNAAVLAAVKVSSSQSSPCSLRSLCVAPGCSGAPLTPAAPRQPSEGVGTRDVPPSRCSGKFDLPCGRRRTRDRKGA